MKTKFYSLALIVSAAVIAQADGGHHGNGGGQAASGRYGAPSGPVSSYRAMPMRTFRGNARIYSGQRFSSVGVRSHFATLNGNIGTRRFAAENRGRGSRFTQFSNGSDHVRTNARIHGTGTGQIRNGNNLPGNWRNHFVAQHSADWHRDWDRSRDHWWHGHRCRFYGDSWVIFDLGFYPWPYWYPYDYYGYGYYPYDYSGYPYPYGYDPGYYNSDASQGDEYYGQNNNESPGEGPGSVVTAAQEQLARDGYYRGRIDGVAGPGTRGAIASFQSDHGLRVTGTLTPDTLQTLGLGQAGDN